jgi:diphosphomevalonate decarboxylase
MTYTSSWHSPSNIALIKYWGKHGLQLPRNPSLSFTLSACHTNMTLAVELYDGKPGVEILYNGLPKSSFEPKINTFFSLLGDFFPWLKGAFVRIDSFNTFPHGAGIASSASAMSALALCLMDINDQINNTTHFPGLMWWRRASEIARLGSGSASRSVFPGAAIWGIVETIDESSDQYAIPWNEHLSHVYKDFQDTILIVSTSEKSVSSTAGHDLMKDHAYAATRYEVARNNIDRLCDVMKHDDLIDTFISIVESEALQLHALMMCGDSPFLLMEPVTIAIIKDVWRFRKATGIPVCFTLDAGPNVHLLYPSQYTADVLAWIKKDLSSCCANGQFIQDHVGTGPQKIEL